MMIERDETELPAEHACRVQRRLRHSHNRYWKRGARGPQTGVERHGNKSRIEVLIVRSEEHTSELQSQSNLVCRLLLEKKKKTTSTTVFRLPSLSRNGSSRPVLRS